MLARNYRPGINIEAGTAGSRPKQHHQSLLPRALLIVLLMLIAAIVIMKYRPSWFGQSGFDLSMFTGSGEARSNAVDSQSKQPAVAASPRKGAKHETTAARESVTHEVAEPVVLPPLQVEVIYGGGRRQTIRSRNASINLNSQNASVAAPAEVSAKTETIVSDAADRVRVSPETKEVVAHPVEPNYPALAKQMKVQGSVVLLARVNQDGDIENLRVLAGPDILAEAALDAVRQWRFRPHLEKGQPVETETRVTVRFTISTY